MLFLLLPWIEPLMHDSILSRFLVSSQRLVSNLYRLINAIFLQSSLVINSFLTHYCLTRPFDPVLLKFSCFFKKGIIEKKLYERRANEPVDDKSLSYISKLDEKNVSGSNGLNE